MASATTITPVLRYRDVGVASRWLCEAFGFEEHNRAQELGGHVRYVSLRLGDSFVLVRPIANSVFDNLMVQPEAVGGASTQTCYLTIADATDHCARAEAAGATIELKPQDDGLGGGFYTCRDPEGHLWSFGTQTYGVAQGATSAFEPTELSPSLPGAGIAPPPGHKVRERAKRSQLLREVGIAAATAILVSGGWLYFDTHADSASRNVETTSVATAARLKEAAEQLAHERSRRLVAEDASKKKLRRDWLKSAPLLPNSDKACNAHKQRWQTSARKKTKLFGLSNHRMNSCRSTGGQETARKPRSQSPKLRLPKERPNSPKLRRPRRGLQSFSKTVWWIRRIWRRLEPPCWR